MTTVKIEFESSKKTSKDFINAIRKLIIESNGAIKISDIESLDKDLVEELEDLLFAEMMDEARTNEFVSMDEVMKKLKS